MDNRFISWQKTRVRNSKTKYWDHTYRTQGKNEHGEIEEVAAANMDVLPAPEPDDFTNETRRRVRKLMLIAKQILTEQQYKVFFFISERAMTERAIAKALGITHQRVHAIWETTRQKLQVAYESRTA